MSQTCYYPNGSIAPDDRPCNASAQQSACCPQEDACMNNGLCFGASSQRPNVLSRNTCTDSNFQDDACPQYCADVNPESSTIVFPVSSDAHDNFCCSTYGGNNNSQCDIPTQGSTQPFRLNNAAMITNRTSGEAKLLNETSSTQQAAPAPATVTVSATGGPILAQTSSVASSSSHDAAIGAGVGVPLGVLLLASLVLLFLEHRKRTQLQQRYQADRENILANLDRKVGAAPAYDPDREHNMLSGTPVAEVDGTSTSR